MIIDNYIIKDRYGIESPVRVMIECPVANDFGYESKVTLEGLHGDLAPIKGFTAFQALQNSVLFLNNLLKGHQDNGVDFYAICPLGHTEKVPFPRMKLIWDEVPNERE